MTLSQAEAPLETSANGVLRHLGGASVVCGAARGDQFAEGGGKEIVNVFQQGRGALGVRISTFLRIAKPVVGLVDLHFAALAGALAEGEVEGGLLSRSDRRGRGSSRRRRRVLEHVGPVLVKGFAVFIGRNVARGHREAGVEKDLGDGVFGLPQVVRILARPVLSMATMRKS